jgi:peptidoglycan-N-acetylglucosamine deacetylase
MNSLRQIVKSLLIRCVSRDRLLVRGPVTQFGRPQLALTFDDGPHPQLTPRLLDQLDQLGLRATFFVIGQRAEQHPSLIRRMIDAGHEVANHTYTHSEPNKTSARTFLDEIHQTDELISNLTGRLPSTVRPPKGELNWAKLRGLWRFHKTVALWNVDPKDFRMSNQVEMTTWCDNYQPRDGDILLMHDNHPYAECAVERLAVRGVFDRFGTTTIAQWLKKTDPAPQPPQLTNCR